MRLIGKTRAELETILQAAGEPKFRAKQLQGWLISMTPFEEMRNLPQSLRSWLRATHEEGYPAVLAEQVSADGTRKYLFGLADGSAVETVLMAYEHGYTVCISTQVGCAMDCAFCASAIGGLLRNLEPEEMLAEVLAVNAQLGEGRQVTNVVLMGTGEPLANYDNVLAFLRLLHAEETLGMSFRNISLSTCGLVPNIYRLAEEDLPVTLCLSLHSPFDEVRKKLMPIANHYTVRETVDALRGYVQKTGRRVVIEYMLLDGVNNRPEDAEALRALLMGTKAHINLIAYNPTNGAFAAPSKRQVYAFLQLLEEKGLSVTLRRALGRDIDGACGQLRAKHD